VEDVAALLCIYEHRNTAANHQRSRATSSEHQESSLRK
jgi:hypothetical protein